LGKINDHRTKVRWLCFRRLHRQGELGATDVSDGAKCYEGIEGFWGYRHVVSAWSALKRQLSRTVGRPTSKFLSEMVR